MINFENVTYEYRQYEGPPLTAVKNLSLTISEGEFVVLAGANGSGKSTLAKMMNSLILPTSGKVKVFGMDSADQSKVYEIRKRVGMVFQNPDNQMIASIVEDDVAFGPENIGLPREEIVRRVEWALDAVGMSEYRHSTPFKMSGGQKQRIAIAGVLAIKPRVLILDEATSMLDPKGRREVMDVVTRLNKQENITVIHITHHMDEAALADRVVVLNDGAVAMDAPPAQIFKDYKTLIKNKLTLPVPAEIAMLLNQAGFGIDAGIISVDLLAEEIWRLL